MVNNKKVLRILIFCVALTPLLIIMIPSIMRTAGNEGEVEGITADMYLKLSAERKSSFDLEERDSEYNLFDGEQFITGSRYAYLWVDITNSGEESADIILSNRTRNYYTELLVPDEDGAVTLFRQGDIVPASSAAFKHFRAAFPLRIPASEAGSFIVEYHGPKGLAVMPEIMSPGEWTGKVAAEQGLAGAICGIFILLILANIMYGVVGGRSSFLPCLFFIVSVFFFFLRQSRILLLIIDPGVYPEWLFPVSVALNIGFGLLFSFSLLKEYLGRRRRKMFVLFGFLTAIFTCASFSDYPYLAADLLNLLTLFTLPVIFSGVIAAIRHKDEDILFISLSFIPWISMIFIDIISGFMDLRFSMSADYRQAFGMITSLFLLSMTIQFETSRRNEREMHSLGAELEQARAEMAGQITSVTELRASVLHQVGYQLRQPLDSIIALASILANEYAVPGITAISRTLAAEAGGLKRLVEKVVGNPGLEEVTAGQDGDVSGEYEKISAPRPWINSRVCIFDTDPYSADRTAVLLRSFGYDVSIESEQYRVLASVTAGKIDVLIVDPTSAGNLAFSVCGLIRGDYNLFEVPILMITNYYADYLMKKGYAAGVNDFLTRPFDSSELAARVQSLIKLKQVAKNNHDLSRSEKEKNTFLYFLTHNINTPLTLLLNRVNELKDYAGEDCLKDISDDLLATSREISDIVQNVLISFRLSDGRQTIRLNEVDIIPIISAVEKDLVKKAADKNQRLIIDLPDDVPSVIGDFSALRGILYNLMDNGIKFSPEGGCVKLELCVDSHVIIDVSDSGPGISAAEQGRLFERFERLSAQPTAGESSTGLGLYVAYELSQMNGGSLAYIPGGPGARFRFILPRLLKEAEYDSE